MRKCQITQILSLILTIRKARLGIMAYNSFFANPPANSTNVNLNAGGLFGLSQSTNATTQNDSTTPSVFGSTTSTAPNPLQFQSTQPFFNANTNTNASKQGGGSLLNSRPNTLSSSTGVGITGQQQLLEAQEQFIKVSQGVETVYNAWLPTSKDCRFQVFFFCDLFRYDWRFFC